jgi:hypothetical protein
VYVSKAATVFDTEGHLVDEKVRASIVKFLGGFFELIDRQRGSAGGRS